MQAGCQGISRNVVSGYAYLIPAVVQFLPETGQLYRQCPDSLSTTGYLQADAAAKSCRSP